MNWNALITTEIPVVLLIVTTLLAFYFGVARDRSNAIRARKIEALTELHQLALQIEQKELSDGRKTTLMVPVYPTAKKKEMLSDHEVHYQNELGNWRQKLHIGRAKASMWIDGTTVSSVSSYFLLMMQCQSWEQFGKGNLLEDKTFRNNLKRVFGRTKQVLDKVTVKHSQTGEPWLVSCTLLSSLCLKEIQRRFYSEVNTNRLWFWILSLYWRKSRTPKCEIEN